MSKSSTSLQDSKTIEAANQACQSEIIKQSMIYGASSVVGGLGGNYLLNEFVPSYRFFFNKQARLLALGILAVAGTFVGGRIAREECMNRTREVLERRERQVSRMANEPFATTAVSVTPNLAKPH